MNRFIILIIFYIISIIVQAAAQETLPPILPKVVDMFVDPDTIDKDECPEGIDPKHCNK